jgi:hypothetical protein
MLHNELHADVAPYCCLKVECEHQLEIERDRWASTLLGITLSSIVFNIVPRVPPQELGGRPPEAGGGGQVGGRRGAVRLVGASLRSVQV